MFIQTLEGTMRANPGDWIITGVHGERYPCKPDIFAETYEPADTAASEDFAIDPEALSIVRQLREELASVTAERDAAVADWNTRQNQPIGMCQICKNSPDLKTKPKDGEEDAEI